MAIGKQFILLLWKNWILQKRKVCVTVFEVLLPLFFGLILVLIRVLVKTKDYPENTIWPASNLLDVGINRSEILYAPDETIIKNIMENVAESINGKLPGKSIQGNVFL